MKLSSIYFSLLYQRSEEFNSLMISVEWHILDAVLWLSRLWLSFYHYLLWLHLLHLHTGRKGMVLLVHGVWWGHWTIIVHQPVEHFRWLFLVCSYTALGVAGIIASLIFSIVYFKLSSSFREVRHLLKWTLYVLVFQFVHILMIMCSAACRIYTLKTRTLEQYSLWFLFALAVPLGVLLFPLGYFLCFHPVGNITQIIYHRCCEHKMLLNQNNTTMQSTAPRSSHVS